MNFLKHDLTKNLSLVFIGNMFAAGMGFFTILIISRVLSVSDFGLFNLVLLIILIVPYLDFGLNISMMKFVSSYLGLGKNDEAVQTIRTVFFMKLFIGLIFSVIIFIAADLISMKMFGSLELVLLIRLASFGVLFVSLFDYFKSALFSYKRFKQGVVLQLLVDFLKIMAVILLVFLLKMNLFVVVVVVFSPLFGVLIGFWFIRKNIFSKEKQIKNMLFKLLFFGKWIFVGNIFRRLFDYIAIFMLAILLNNEVVGIYGLALNLTYIFPILVLSLRSVLLPEVSRFRKTGQFTAYLKNSLKISLYLTIPIIPFLFFSKYVIIFFFGARYASAVVIFNWLLVSYISFIIVSILRQVLYASNRTKIVALIEFLRVITMVLGCLFFIPLFGITAPAIISFIINTTTLFFLALYMLKTIPKKVIFSSNRLNNIL